MRTAPLRTSFKKMLKSITGKRIERATMDASSGNRQAGPEELQALARLSRAATREPIKMEPGKKVEIIMHSDIDPETGRVYSDYLARRKKRREEEGENLEWLSNHNWRPDD